MLWQILYSAPWRDEHLLSVHAHVVEHVWAVYRAGPEVTEYTCVGRGAAHHRPSPANPHNPRFRCRQDLKYPPAPHRSCTSTCGTSCTIVSRSQNRLALAWLCLSYFIFSGPSAPAFRRMP